MGSTIPVRATEQGKPAELVVAQERATGFDPALTKPISIIARRRLGESDLTVFPIALSGSAFGWTADVDTSAEILDRYLDHGGNLIDTADSYASGRSEIILGNWMRSRRLRDSLVIATKIGRNADNPGLGSVNMVRAVEASLERLKTDHIDVLTFHDDDRSVHLEDILATAEWLIESGKVRHLAAANFSADRLIEARILSSLGLPKFTAVQSHYTLMHREEFEGDLRIVTSAQGLGVMPYSAMADGFLAGGPRQGNDIALRARGGKVDAYTGRKGHRVLSALDRVAADQASTASTIALAWLLAKRNVSAPIATASSPEDVDAAMAAAAVRLTRAQMLELDRVS